MKKNLAIIMILVMMLGLVACGSKEQNSNKPDDSTPTKEVTSEATKEPTAEVTAEPTKEPSAKPTSPVADNKVTYPVKVTDQAGREVTIEKEPEKLVSSYYISTSMLVALGLDEKLVGIEAKANKRPLFKKTATQLVDLPSIGTAKEVDIEGVVALTPDLVIIPLRVKEAAAKFEELGITTIIVNPESDDLLMEMLDIVSTATNTKDRAEEIKTYIDDKKAMLNDKLGSLEAKNVYFAGNSSVLSTCGSKMYQSDLLTLAGGKNLAFDLEDDYWADVNYEQVIAWNPDYIIIAASAEYSVEDVLNDANLSVCNAVVNKNVYKMPSDIESWDTPIPAGILGSVWISSNLHPDVISSEESNTIIEEFYEKFYGFK